jgi:hypothetical protein
VPALLVAASPSMFSRRKIGRPCTGALQIAVRTLLPCQVISRGRPTLSESKRAIASFYTGTTTVRETDLSSITK